MSTRSDGTVYTAELMFADLGLKPQTVVVPRLTVGGPELRDAGLEQVWSGTSEQWRHVALDALYRLACQQPTLDADDLWPVLPSPPPGSHNVIGALWMSAVRLGYVCKTGIHRRSSRPSAHARDIPVDEF